MRSVGELCSKDPVIATGDESLGALARRMRDHHVGCVVIVEPGPVSKPIGLVTDRDMVVRVLAQTDRHLEQVRADDIMARPVVTTNENDELAVALSVMRTAGVRRLPVVNEAGGLIGLLSFDDLIDYVQDVVGELTTLLGRERREEQRLFP